MYFIMHWGVVKLVHEIKRFVLLFSRYSFRTEWRKQNIDKFSGSLQQKTFHKLTWKFRKNINRCVLLRTLQSVVAILMENVCKCIKWFTAFRVSYSQQAFLLSLRMPTDCCLFQRKCKMYIHFGARRYKKYTCVGSSYLNTQYME
jgi:hypothetical protein